MRYRELERGYAAVRWQEADAATGEVRAGLGPIVALRHRSSTLSQICVRGASAPLFLNENATQPFDAFGLWTSLRELDWETPFVVGGRSSKLQAPRRCARWSRSAPSAAATRWSTATATATPAAGRARPNPANRDSDPQQELAVLGAQGILIFTAVNPYRSDSLGPDNIPGGPNRARRSGGEMLLASERDGWMHYHLHRVGKGRPTSAPGGAARQVTPGAVASSLRT